MKNIFLLLLVAIAVLPVRAQRIIEKHLDIKTGGSVRMDFQISDSIRVITWNKNEVYIKSSIDVNDNKDNDEYVMSYDGSGDEVVIKGKLKWREGRGSRIYVKRDSGSKGDDCCCCDCNSEIIHEVYIPEGSDFSVETINGNIVITGKPGAVRAHTISGWIDLAVAPERAGSVEMRTISGTMYSNYNFPTDVHKPRRVGGGRVTEELNGGRGKRIDLETISGDIFFRKA
jgi:hypothetical protein